MIQTKTKLMGALAVAAMTAVITISTESAKAISLDSVTSSADYSAFINGTNNITDFGNRLIDFNNSPFVPGEEVSPNTVFDNKNQEATFSGLGRVVIGNKSGQYAAPASKAAGSTSAGLTNNTPYLTLGGKDEGGPVALEFKFPIIERLGFLWGSVDSYNSVEFFKGTESRGTFTGLNVLKPANGSQQPDGTYFVNFVADSEADWFDKVVFTSTRAAFEIDDIRYTEVPTPALLPGLVGMGVAAFRKRKQAGEAQSV